MISTKVVRRLAKWVYFISLIILALSQNGPPELTVTGLQPVVTIKENSPKAEELKVIRCTDPEDTATRVYLRSLTPQRPCASCFQVSPCPDEKKTKTKFCLVYYPEGELSFRSAPSYVAQITCTDEESEVNSVIDIRVLDNQAPVFENPPNDQLHDSYLFRSTFTKGKEGVKIYDVNAKDEECDAILYTLTTDVARDLFEIGYGNGTIRAAKDLRLLCGEENVRMSVAISDNLHYNVGPAVISTRFKDGNTKPQVSSMEAVIRLKENPDHEDASVDAQVLLLDVEDSTVPDRLRVTMRAEPERGLEYYYLELKNDNWKVRTRKRLDYENELLRSVRLFFEVNDGFCFGEEYSVLVEIEDVNELPEIFPDYIERTVYEGFIEIDPGWAATDPDTDENLVWSMVTDASGSFDVDPVSGRIFSVGEFDVDPNAREKSRTIEVRVLDKEGERAKAKMKITVLDKNDNVPEFRNPHKQVSASECTRVGSHLDRVTATDKDSLSQGNGDLVYGGQGQYLSILANGKIVLTRNCSEGDAESFQATVSDQGEYPGPLSGTPATVTFSCNKCPDPKPDTGGDNENGPATINWTRINNGEYANDAADISGSGMAQFLSWLIPAILMATVLLAALIYVIWRGCYVIIRRCRRRASQQRLKKKKVVPRKVNTIQPKKEEDAVEVIKLSPPDPPPPEPEPHLFGFWKETYVDRDQRHFPERDIVPIPVGQDRLIEEREKVEELEEKEQWRQEKLKVKEDYLKEYEKYKQELSTLQNPRVIPKVEQSPPPPKKPNLCRVL